MNFNDVIIHEMIYVKYRFNSFFMVILNYKVNVIDFSFLSRVLFFYFIHTHTSDPPQRPLSVYVYYVCSCSSDS